MLAEHREALGGALAGVEMTIDYPRTHDPAPVLLQEIGERRLLADPAVLASLGRISARLAELRAPAFYLEVPVTEEQARDRL